MTVMVFWSLLACKPIEPAPTEIDDLAHYFWQDFLAEDEVLAPALINLHAAVGGDTLDEPLEGTITDLSEASLAAVGMEHNDPARPAGIFFANVVNCTLEEFEAANYALNQAELHESTYEDYHREYTSDFDAYTARETDTLRWQTVYSVKQLGVEFTATLDGTMHYISAVDDAASPHGDVIMVRGVLAEPAYIEGSDGERGLMQDYQLELYYERAPRELVHFYVIWRDMVYTSSIDFDSESAQRLVLDGFIDWDEETEAWCSGG